MKSIRIRRGDLQVATHAFYSPLTGRHIRLVGVCHISSGDFWDQTQRYIETAQHLFPKAEVHFEGVFDDTGGPATRLRDGYTKIADALGLVAQHEGLKYDTDWVRTDLNLSQVLEKLDDPDAFMKKQRDLYEGFSEMADNLTETPALVAWARRFLRYALAVMHTTRGKSNEYSVIIDERNRHAVSTMVATGTDIITLWGAEHLKGMSKILLGCGYEHLHTHWNTCVPRKLSTR